MAEDGNQMAFRDLEIQELMTRAKTLAGELDRRLKEVAYGIDRKDLAAVNDLSYSYISEILNTNGDQKQIRTSMIPSLALLAPDRFVEALGFLCEIAGYNPPKKKNPLTSEQELTRVKRRIRERGLEPLFEDLR